MRFIAELEDLRRLYIKKVPRMFTDYAQSGSWHEQTLFDNCHDLRKIKFKQVVAKDLNNRSTACKIIGQKAAMPVVLSPIGSLGMQRDYGEIKAAKAANTFGVPFTLSTMSICSIEQVAEATQSPFWFQLYVMKDRTFVQKLVKRAKIAGCSALVLTVDLQILGKRHRDHKNGLTIPPRLSKAVLFDMLTKQGWSWRMLFCKSKVFGNIVGHVEDTFDTRSMINWTARQFELSLDWDKIKELRQLWTGKFIIKGIQSTADAQKAAEIGIDALVVSNHGGRQLDGALSSIRSLKPVIDAVSNQCEVHVDSGFRSGQDVMRALALGAKAVHIGRPYVYGLGAIGEQGVNRVLELFHEELDLTMAFCGARRIDEINRSNIYVPRGFHFDNDFDDRDKHND